MRNINNHYLHEKSFIIILLTLFTGVLKAQNTQKDSIYSFVELPPTPYFANGNFSAYIAKNIRYPVKAIKEHKQGKVFIQFIIRKDGRICNAVIIRSVSPDIDAEALRVVNSSPPWKPGIQNGQPVSVSYVIPITFNLGLPVQNSEASSKKTDTTSHSSSLREDTLNHLTQHVQSNDSLNTLNQIFSSVEQQPSFPGGSDKLNKFIRNKVAQLQDGDYTGKVTINFVVEKDGHLSNFQIFRGSDKKSNDMAIAIMNDSPKWNPGMQQGQPARVEYSVAVSF